MGFISVASDNGETLNTDGEIMSASNYGKFRYYLRGTSLGLTMALNKLFGFYSHSQKSPKDAISLVKFLSIFCDIKDNKWNSPKVSEDARFTMDVVNEALRQHTILNQKLVTTVGSILRGSLRLKVSCMN